MSEPRPIRPCVLVVITRAEAGGAQVHVRDLVLGLSDRAAITVAVGEDGFLVDALREQGVPVRVLPDLQREIAARADAGAVRALRRLIREVRPALVHTHSTKAGLLGRLAARSLGVPCIHTAHAWSFSDGLSWKRKAMAIPLEAAVGRVTDRFIVVSEADREIALRYRVATESQVTVVHNGVVDTPHRASPGQGDVPVITMVARLAAPKDPLLLLEALAGVSASFALRIVGDGPDRPAVQAAVARHGLGDRVTLLGRRMDVPELLAESDVFALVSKQEGFPLAILEAMRAGLPVVASDVGGVREAVRPETGRLVPRSDTAALQRALSELLSDAALRVSLGAAGRAAYEARFSAARMLDRTFDTWLRVLSAPRSPVMP